MTQNTLSTFPGIYHMTHLLPGSVNYVSLNAIGLYYIDHVQSSVNYTLIAAAGIYPEGAPRYGLFAATGISPQPHVGSASVLVFPGIYSMN